MDRTASRYRLIWVFLLAAMITACQQTPSKPPAAETPQTQSAEELLAQAAKAENVNARNQLLLQAADRLQEAGEKQQARQLLLQLQSQPLSGELQDQYRLLALRGAVNAGDASWAQSVTRDLPVEQFQQYPPELQPRVAELQQQAFVLSGRYLKAAETALQTRQLLGSEAIGQDLIWRWLQRVPFGELEERARTASTPDLQGWLELALQLRAGPITLEEQSALIRNWQKNWPDHPAARQLPDELEMIASLPDRRPERVVLALPLSGPLGDAGKAVREGFVAAFYKDQKLIKRSTEVDIVDTNEESFSSIYAEQLTENPDLVIGPLSKTALASLADQDQLPVPVLALNYLDESATAPQNLFQFGLSAEDEARQIAQRLAWDGKRRVVMIAPEGGWGDRVVDAFRIQDEELGGHLLDTVRFGQTDSLRTAVSDLFGIHRSRQRAIQVEETIAMDVKFEPRRRQDIDAVVMIASPEQARQLKPLFAFYFGGDLPVYSPSLVYAGQPDPSRDADLENVRFTDLPWVLGEPPELRQALWDTFPRLARQYDRLFALGADAYRLSSRLPLLENIPSSQVAGYTGLLTMNEHREIHRMQEWAVFNNGTPEVKAEIELNGGSGSAIPAQPESRSDISQ
ncbi:penicillin-binding protein activator [Marinobacteraceae bacterium S3BR75-40.1]